MTAVGDGPTISIHVYGADIERLGSSIYRRFDDWPVLPTARARADLGGERRDVVGTLVAAAVDEEGRRPRDAALVGARDVAATRGAYSRRRTSSQKPLDVEAELLGVAAHVHRQQLVLVGDQQVVHLPERGPGRRRPRPTSAAICARGWTSLSGRWRQT